MIFTKSTPPSQDREPVAPGLKLESMLQRLAAVYAVDPFTKKLEPPYPLVPPPNVPLMQWDSMRIVVSGQMFGISDLPEA